MIRPKEFTMYVDDPYDLDDEPRTGDKAYTQGGGIAIFNGTQYVWDEPPTRDFPEMKWGEPVPEEWGLIPIINKAHG